MRKRILAFMALFATALCFAEAGDASKFVVPNGHVTTRDYYTVPTVECPSKGFLSPASASMSISGNTAKKVDSLPSGTKRFRIWVHPGKGVNFGPKEVASNTAYPHIASGTLSDYFNVSGTEPEFYFIGVGGNATGTLICE